MKRRYLALSFAVLIAAAAVRGSFGYDGAEARSDEVRIACNLPLTGVFATYGAAVQEGAEFAFADGRIGADTKLRFDWQDNEGLPVRAVSVLRQQLLRKPLLYMSGVRPQAMAIWDEVARTELPHLLWIFDADIRKSVATSFRTWVSFAIEPPLFIDYAAKRQAKKVAVIYVRLPHTDEEYLDVIAPGLRAGGAEVMIEGYDINRAEFRDLGAKTMAFKPDLIILSGFQNHLVSMIRTLRTLRLIQEGNTLVTYDLLDTAPLLDPAEIEGLRVTVPSFLLDPDDSAYGRWRSRFTKRFGKEPLYTHAYAYDMVLILADAALRLKEETPAALARAIQSTDIEGVTGRLRFNEKGDLDTKVELGIYRDGILRRESSSSGPG